MNVLYALILLLALASPAHAADRVQNVRFFQQGNRVVVEYHLTGDKPADVQVSLKVNGESRGADRLHLEGDFGKNVKPGRKRLIWNVLQDFPRGFNGEYVWDITAGGGAFTDPTTGMVFVDLPGGCSQIGDTFGDGAKNEKPVHEVCVEGFSMGKYEVTNAQYRKFKPDHKSKDYKGNSMNGDNQPVVNVSWEDATEYARWLSQQSGKSYRLPTEAEWEYAARGGVSARNYWGDGNDDACGYANVYDLSSKNTFNFIWAHHNCDDGNKVTAPVGSYKPNAFGLYDMMGNVWEWTQDWYEENYSQSSPKNNPQGPSSGKLRVLRGASWGDRSEYVRASKRGGSTPVGQYSVGGFRLVSPRNSRILPMEPGFYRSQASSSGEQLSSWHPEKRAIPFSPITF